MQQINVSCNAELLEGATDGKYKKTRPNTRVGDWAGHSMTMNNRSALVVPGTEMSAAWGPLPLDRQEAGHKVRPA